MVFFTRETQTEVTQWRYPPLALIDKRRGQGYNANRGSGRKILGSSYQTNGSPQYFEDLLVEYWFSNMLAVTRLENDRVLNTRNKVEELFKGLNWARKN